MEKQHILPFREHIKVTIHTDSISSMSLCVCIKYKLYINSILLYKSLAYLNITSKTVINPLINFMNFCCTKLK